jgi:hypothetical protein
LRCSRNARSQKTLVGRAQWETNRATPCKRSASELGRSIDSSVHGTRTMKGMGRTLTLVDVRSKDQSVLFILLQIADRPILISHAIFQ